MTVVRALALALVDRDASRREVVTLPSRSVCDPARASSRWRGAIAIPPRSFLRPRSGAHVLAISAVTDSGRDSCCAGPIAEVSPRSPPSAGLRFGLGLILSWFACSALTRAICSAGARRPPWPPLSARVSRGSCWRCRAVVEAAIHASGARSRACASAGSSRSCCAIAELRRSGRSGCAPWRLASVILVSRPGLGVEGVV
jgi:hypothetical protein